MGKIWDMVNSGSWRDYRTIRTMREGEKLMKMLQEKEREKEVQQNTLQNQQFCNICGISLNLKNIKGKCVECEMIICKKCASPDKNNVVCSNCIKLKEPIKRKPGFSYFVDVEGNIREQKFLRSTIISKIITRPGFIYTINKEGKICLTKKK